MKFARVEMLFLIWAVPVFFLVFLFGMKKRRKILSRFSSAKGLKKILINVDFSRRSAKAALALSVLLFLSLALAGPQYGYRWQEIERRGVDIIIALDCSRSMMADDIIPTRLDRARHEVYDLIAMLKGDRIGIVAFAGTAFLQCPLTLDYEAFHIFLDNLSPDFLPVGGTDIAGAITTSVNGFDKNANTEKAVIIITDGENTTRDDPLYAAEDAKKAGVKLFCIGVGSEQGVPLPEKNGSFKKDSSGKIILTKLDEDMLKKIAVMTGGTYVRSVAGDMDLDAIYTNEIRAKMESSTLESGRRQVWEDRYQWFAVMAFLALVIELFIPAAKKSGIAIILIFLIQPFSAYAGPASDGFAAYEKGDYEKALKLFIDAQLENPDKPEILYNIGNTYYKLGDFDSAINNFKAVLDAENKSLKQKALYNLANSKFKKGMLEEAVKNYEEALKLDPNDIKAKENLEFVKKMIEQKKNQEEKKHDSGKDKSEKKDEEKQGDNSNKNSEDQKQQSENKEDKASEQNEPESERKFGSESDASHQPENDSSQQSSEPENDDKKQPAAAQAKPSDESDPEGKKQQAERILNRLTDQPGRAMIPSYQKRHVEKDW